MEKVKTEVKLSLQLQAAINLLKSSSPSPRLDAELLLCHILSKSRSYLYAWPERVLTEGELGAYEECIDRRACGEPVAHFTGRREFWSLELEVSEDTLVPRPETELLVECALERIPAEASWKLADLGTGTGAVALAVAKERPACRVLATDISAEALVLAQHNARRLQIHNVDFIRANWLTGLPAASLDMVLSNPPYIADADPCLADGDLRFEPHGALASGPEGLDDLRRVIPEAFTVLRSGGWLLLEHGTSQGAAVWDLLGTHGYLELCTWRDLAGHERISGGRRG